MKVYACWYTVVTLCDHDGYCSGASCDEQEEEEERLTYGYQIRLEDITLFVLYHFKWRHVFDICLQTPDDFSEAIDFAGSGWCHASKTKHLKHARLYQPYKLSYFYSRSSNSRPLHYYDKASITACIALISIFRFYHIPKDIQKIICEFVGEIKY